ncbi:xylose isomerase [Sphingobacterium lumbrici]|uniref:xylose isomerase n=1 Tax=Sphingobacterium lumbrici TaxID=2559600 RepID=UPI001125E7BF|nr:xylose isomerase [Sphingobacterium lumbrici]
MKILTGNQVYFETVGRVEFEGVESDNPLAFRWYDPTRVVAGKTMAEHFKFACTYWHSFNGNGSDPFGSPAHFYSWERKASIVERAKEKMDSAFEFMTKMQLPYYCFHDIDLIDYTDDMLDNERNVEEIVAYAKEKQEQSGVKLLWGAANLFSHHRYMNGASTNPDFQVVAYAGAQVKVALHATIELGGENYVFGGGREGYMSLVNTNMKRERAHLAQFLHMSKDYARKNGFQGTFFIEPKPFDPTKHQYGYDAETVVGFLREFDLLDDFKLNLVTGHATLAGHTFQHELQVAADAGMLGSIAVNRSEYQKGWDTDQFPADLNELTKAMLTVLEAGGLNGGGVNFDAKVKHNATDSLELFYAHIGGMDNFARALLIADRILQHSDYKKIRNERYVSFNAGVGLDFEKDRLFLEDLWDHTISYGTSEIKSSRQEYMENLIARYL